jgi:hypothetical protein
MTVTAEQIAIAKSHGLTNVEALAAAADKHNLRFYLACTILDKESDGKNIYGHDAGGTFTQVGNREVTEANFREFWSLVAPPPEGQGKRSNGVGPMQITYKPFLADMLAKGLKPWDPADNIDYGVGLIAKTYRAQRDKGRTVTESFRTAANVYNLGHDSDTWHYGIDAVNKAAIWKERVGTADLGPDAPPPPPPSDVGDWMVNPDKVTTHLRGRDKAGAVVTELKPGTVITDGVAFGPNWLGRIALWTAGGVSYDREFLVQVGPDPDPERPLPVIPTYDGTERLRFRNRRVCICVATSLPFVEHRMLEEGVIRFNIDIYQGGYNTTVTASKGTHDEGGNTDVGQYSFAALKIWREMGWAMQHRTKAQGFSGDHGHGWPVGCPHLSEGAEWQASEWNLYRNGLRSRGRVTGPAPTGKLTPTWVDGLMAYKARFMSTTAAGLPMPENFDDGTDPKEQIHE